MDVPPILVAEDEALIRLALAEALEEGGYSVVEEADGRTAWHEIDGEWPANGVPQSTVLQKPFASAALVTAVANLLVAQQSIPSQA